MTVQVKTFGSMSEAAAALASDRAARFFSGGTLLMRAINEGDTTIATLVRATDPGYRQIRNEGARIVIGAGVRMVDILASRDLAFLHPVARVIGGPAVRAMATVGGNLFAPSPYGDFTVALLALDATVMVQGAYGGAQQTPLEQFLAGRDRAGSGGLVTAVSVPRPASPDAFRFRKVARVKPKGVSVLSIAAHLPADWWTHRRRARRLRRHGADADPRPRRRAGAGGPQPRCGRHRPGARRRRGRHQPRHRRSGQRLVPPRGGRHPPAPPAARRGRVGHPMSMEVRTVRRAPPDSPPPCGEGLGVGGQGRGDAKSRIRLPLVLHPTRQAAPKARLATLPIKGRVTPSRVSGGPRWLEYRS